MKASTVLIVDDEKPIRQWFEYVIRQCEEEFECVGVCSNGKEALELYEQHRPDIIITDIRMPVMGGLELIRTIKERGGSTQFLILSNYDHFEYVKKGLVMGAKDYLLKAETADLEIIEALRKIRQTAEGHRTAGPGIAGNDPEIAAVFIRDLLRHPSIECELSQQISTYLAENSLCPGYLLVCSIDGYDAWSADQSEDGTRQWPASLIAMVRQQFRRWISAAAAVQTGENENTFIVSKKSADVQAMAHMLRQFCEETNAETNSRFGRTLSFGLGGPFEKPEEMKRAYSQAIEALEYRFYSGPAGFHAFESFEKAGEARERCLVYVQQLLKNFQFPPNEKLVDQIDHVFDLLIQEGRNGLKPQEAKKIMINLLEMINHRLAGQMDGSALGALLYDPSVLNQAGEFIESFRRWISQQISVMLQAAAEHTFQYSEATNTIIRYLYEHYSQKVSMAQLARLVHLNENYISQMFKKETGQSVTRYLLSIRMERAKELLLENRLKIHEIAAEVCYTSESHFGTAFKLYFGKSPRNYIEHLRISK